MIKQIFLILLFFVTIIRGQETDIIPQLKKIETGEIESAKEDLQRLKMQHPDDPSVMFLDAILRSNAAEAFEIYTDIFYKYPKSKYADAALYRIFSYYYSIGSYKKADEFIDELKKNYPDSPYLTAAYRTIPEEDDVMSSGSAGHTKTGTTKETTVSKTAYTIQAGAFLDISNARKLKERFESNGLSSEIKAKEVGGTTLNVVLVGSFSTEDEAKAFLSKINSEYNILGRIVKN